MGFPYLDRDPGDEQPEPTLCEVCPERMEAEGYPEDEQQPNIATRTVEVAGPRGWNTVPGCEVCRVWLEQEAERAYDAKHADDGYDNDTAECEQMRKAGV